MIEFVGYDKTRRVAIKVGDLLEISFSADDFERIGANSTNLATLTDLSNATIMISEPTLVVFEKLFVAIGKACHGLESTP